MFGLQSVSVDFHTHTLLTHKISVRNCQHVLFFVCFCLFVCLFVCFCLRKVENLSGTTNRGGGRGLVPHQMTLLPPLSPKWLRVYTVSMGEGPKFHQMALLPTTCPQMTESLYSVYRGRSQMYPLENLWPLLPHHFWKSSYTTGQWCCCWRGGTREAAILAMFSSVLSCKLRGDNENRRKYVTEWIFCLPCHP